MGSTIQEYLASLRGKRVAVLGIGVSTHRSSKCCCGRMLR